MGAADAIPGVSGGTIALIAGVYDQLINSLTSLSFRNLVRLLSAVYSIELNEVKVVMRDIDFPFLFSLGVGVVTALVIVTRIVHFANSRYPVLLFGFFFGLIAASALILSVDITLSKHRHYSVAFIGFIFAFTISGDYILIIDNSLHWVFISGMIAISAMILPGISGSLILILLGQYTYLSETLTQFTIQLSAVIFRGTTKQTNGSGMTVLAFIGGAIIGLITISRLVDYALTTDRETTLAFLVSLVFGALRAPVTELSSRPEINWTSATLLRFIIIAVAGGGFLLLLNHYSSGFMGATDE